MTGYKIYLTKSSEVAYLLAKAHQVGEDGVTRVSYGPAYESNIIPAIYQDQGYYYCIVEQDRPDRPGYELIFT